MAAVDGIGRGEVIVADTEESAGAGPAGPSTAGAALPSDGIRFDERSWHTYGSSVSPDATAFAYIVDDGTGYPKAAQHELSPERVGDLRWVRIPASGPVRKVVHSTDGAWLAAEVAPSGGEHHQVWVVSTDPDDDTAHRVAATRPGGGPFGTVALVGWDTDWVLISAIEPDGTAHALRAHPSTGSVTTLDVRTSGALVDSWKDASLLWVGPRGYRDMLLLRRSDRPTGLVPDSPAGAAGSNTADPSTADPGAVEITPLLPNDPGAVTDQGYILDQGFAHPSLVFTAPPHHTVRDLSSVQALVHSDFDAKYPRLLGIEAAQHGVRFRVLAERSDAGLDEFAVSHDQSTVALLWNTKGYSELQILTLPDQTLHPPIELPGSVASELSISAAGTLVSLTVASPSTPPLVHLVNTMTGEVTAIDGDLVADDDPSAMLRPELVEFSARDGMPLSGWLFRAPNAEGPTRTLVYFHGGPEAQSRPDYNFLFGPLVNAGINVFAPNVRGSSGFGRLFTHADDRYGRYAGINDAADCAAHLVDIGVAERTEVYCAGRSYGGYLTLACLTFHPDVFAAGISICGMSDLESFFANTEPWIALAAYSKYGHPEHDRELLRDLSPIHRIAEVTAPLLVIHGAHDTNVPVSESELIVDELRARSHRAELLLFDDEGHEILKRRNQRRLVESVVDWILRPAAGEEVPTSR